MEEIKTAKNLVKGLNTFKLIISEELESKIRHLCREVWEDEWSGVLFYKPDGKFEDGSLVIKCVDICIMDVGTTSYTEFNMSPRVINYMTENIDLLDCQMGLIHSHNNMAAFFSGTDLATLKEEGIDRNHFVSLIVNNRGKYVAAITRKMKSKTVIEECTYYSFGGEEVLISEPCVEEKEQLEYFELDIEFENTCIELKNSLEEIKENKKIKQAFRKEQFVQKNLFDQDNNITLNYKKNENQVYLPKYVEKEELDFEINESQIHDLSFNKNTINSLALQLITGSVILPNESRIDPNKWSTNMSSLYERRFGKNKEGLELFRTWAEGYIEFLCWYSEDEELSKEGIDDDEMAAICADDLIEYLTKLPGKNDYIEIYIDILKGYLI